MLFCCCHLLPFFQSHRLLFCASASWARAFVQSWEFPFPSEPGRQSIKHLQTQLANLPWNELGMLSVQHLLMKPLFEDAGVIAKEIISVGFIFGFLAISHYSLYYLSHIWFPCQSKYSTRRPGDRKQCSYKSGREGACRPGFWGRRGMGTYKNCMPAFHGK